MKWKTNSGEWVLITGASAGIGKAYAEELAARKMNLILVARRKKELTVLAEKLTTQYGIKTLVVPVDLSADGFLKQIITLTKDQPVDLLINNAGFGTSGLFLDIEGDKEETMIKVNCLAPVILTRHYLKGMKERNHGGLIFLSSIAANQPSPAGITYSATKVFDRYIGEGLHYELKKTNIEVLTVLPGATLTEFQEVADYNAIKGSRTAEQVVQTSLKYLGRRRTVTDGIKNRLMGLAAQMVPRSAAIHAAYRWAEGKRKREA